MRSNVTFTPRVLAPLGIACILGALAVGSDLGRSPGSSSAEPAPAWKEASAAGFVQEAKLWLAAPITEGAIDGLRSDLERAPEVATRAAVLLGAVLSDDARSGALRARSEAALMRHLERRQPTSSRGAEGSEIVAARALQDAATEVELRRRLVALAVGARPHPDLATRVECAAVVAHYDVQAVLPFLLSVLRAETPDQVKSPRSWERITTLAWIKTRSAEALSAAAEQPLTFRPDGGWAHQVEEANRLEAALRAR